MPNRYVFPFHIVIGTSLFAVFVCAVIIAAQTGFIGKQSENNQKSPDIAADSSFYEPGDWSRYILHGDDQDSSLEPDRRNEDTINFDGSFKAGVIYGKSRFTKEKYRQSADDKATSLVINNGVLPYNEFKLQVQGKAGKRLTLYIDHDSTRENKDENKYIIKYQAVNDDEILRELNAGDIDISATGSKYALFESKAEKAYGVDVTFRKNNFTLKAFGSVSKGNIETETFKGTARAGSISISEYQYIHNKYFQLEPFLRFDKISSSSSVSSLGSSAYSSLITFTSNPSSPSSYYLTSVNIQSGSIELWIDDQSGVVKNGVFSNPPDGGNYIKMTEGSDFTVNYTTGEITFIRTINDSARIFAGYCLAGGSVSSCDPSARTDIVANKIFVFIKYGTLLEEDIDKDGVSNGDTNKDGKINHDIYEIKSYYNITEKSIQPDTMRIDLYKDNRLLSAGILLSVGRFELDCSNGLFRYYAREPFRPLLSASDASAIYGSSSSQTYMYSHYIHTLNYYCDARKFQLKHINIVEGSVSIKINGATIAPSVYSVNNFTGVIEFSNPNNPIITDSSQIAIHYQYSSDINIAQGFTGGLRSDYKINDMLSVGGTVLYSKQGNNEKAPTVGEEPTSTVVLEGDTTLKISPYRFTTFASALTGTPVKTIPLEFTGYTEYAKSYHNQNTFGKAIVDDMESSTDTTTISMLEQSFFISSQPSSSTRGILNYKYYRNPSSPETLKDESFTPYSLDYSLKSGPYNIAAGHLLYADSDKNKGQKSIVFDFNYTTGNTVSAGVRLDAEKKEVDLSGLQYIEVWYKAASGSGNVQLTLDAGLINEDSDGDGILDTEDTNYNGLLDAGEDKGYTFNQSGYPSTKVGGGTGFNAYSIGDGVLSSEDINGNGILDTTESIMSFPGTKSYNEGSAVGVPINISLTDTSWKSAKIYINRNNLTDADKYLLAHSRVLRINLKNVSATSGKVMINSIRLVGVKWSNVKVNGVLEDNPLKFSASVIDTQNDSEYYLHSFVRELGNIYESLYGNRTNSELTDELESTLAITYNLGGSYASTSRTIQKTMDLSKYKTIHMWINPREMTSGDIFRFSIGTSENDYYTYEKQITSTGTWQELAFLLQDTESGAIEPKAITGYPELTAIRFMKIEIVSSGQGRIWVNNILANNPISKKGDAYWTEGNINITQPLFKTDSGTKVFNNLKISYIQKSHSNDFYSPGRSDNGTYEKVQDIRSTCEIIPRLEMITQFIKSKYDNNSYNDQISQDLRGSKGQDTYLLQLDYTSLDYKIPSVSFLYRYNSINTQRQDISTAGDRLSILQNYLSQSPRISIQERFLDFINGKWIFNIVSDNTFLKTQDLTGITIMSEAVDSRQKNDLKFNFDYEYGYFFISPEVSFFNHDINTYKGKTSSAVLYNPNGNFHLPFISNSSFKFVERNTACTLKTGTRKTNMFTPVYTIDYKYNQNGFTDFLQEEVTFHPNFERQHNAQSTASSDITLPFTFNSFQFGYFKSFILKYNRSVSLDETYVPYENEKAGLLNEKYGLSNSVKVLANNAYNFITYYPGYFLKGRGNYSKGRDFVYNNMNSLIYYSNGTSSPYTNYFKTTDNLSLSPSLNFYGFDLSLNYGFTHLAERSSVGSVPSQQITWFCKNDLIINLMDLFTFGFFRPNSPEITKHGATMTIGYTYTQTSFITRNLVEKKYTPALGFSFTWGQSALSLKGSFDRRFMNNHEYISSDSQTRNSLDTIYYTAMSKSLLYEADNSYSFSCHYETQMELLHSLITHLYPVSTPPTFIIEYRFIKNLYDYKYTTSPEPYDLNMITSSIKFNYHKNINAELSGRTALERWYNRDDHHLYKVVHSYEFSGQLTLQF